MRLATLLAGADGMQRWRGAVVGGVEVAALELCTELCQTKRYRGERVWSSRTPSALNEVHRGGHRRPLSILFVCRRLAGRVGRGSPTTIMIVFASWCAGAQYLDQGKGPGGTHSYEPGRSAFRSMDLVACRARARSLAVRGQACASVSLTYPMPSQVGQGPKALPDDRRALVVNSDGAAEATTA
jgi:hypothetical protein